MKTINKILGVAIIIMAVWAGNAFAETQQVKIIKFIDYDHLVITTESHEQLVLERWGGGFISRSVEGKRFDAEISFGRVTIHLGKREELRLVIMGSLDSSRFHESWGRECYKTYIREPQTFLGDGGEIFILEDGTIWRLESHQHLNLHVYHPEVIVCPSAGKMFLRKHAFEISQVR